MLLVEKNNECNNKIDGESDQNQIIINESTTKITYNYEFQVENNADEEKNCEGTLNKSQVFEKSKLWQILPSTSVSLLCVSFGIMLGWPSPTYMILLDQESSPLPITMVQSPMIAGFLMFGTISTTPFSTWKFYGTKYGILTSLIIVSFGWLTVWVATNIYHLLMSRFMIGMGTGYGIGQIKIYINELTVNDLKLRGILTKCVNVHMIIGVLIAYSMGLYFDFRDFSMSAFLITAFVFFLCTLVPHSPSEYMRLGYPEQARKMSRKMKNQMNLNRETMGNLGQLFRKKLSKSLVTLFLLVFVQQFSGGPATIVYCQFMFRNLNVARPELCAIFYCSTYLVAYVLGTFYVSSLKNKRSVLILSSIAVCSVLASSVLLLHYEIMHGWLSLAMMLLYIFCYGCGWATVPNSMVEILFPKEVLVPAGQLQLMLFCIFAVIITKLFQVFYSAFPGEFWLVFVLFFFVNLFGIPVAILVPINNHAINNENIVV